MLEYGRRHGLVQQHLKASRAKGETDKARAAIAASLGGKEEGEEEAEEVRLGGDKGKGFQASIARMDLSLNVLVRVCQCGSEWCVGGVCAVHHVTLMTVCLSVCLSVLVCACRSGSVLSCRIWRPPGGRR